MTRPISQPVKPWQPSSAIEYLPVRALCPDGRLRMVRVAHRWEGGVYAYASDVCGRVPARALSYKGLRDVPGFYADSCFYPRKED